MRRTSRIAVSAAVGLLLLVVGLVLGYRAGYNDSAVLTASVQSALTIGALRALRQDKPDEAIHRLETSLDGNLITYWALEKEWRPSVELFGHDNERKLFQRAADYRKEFPSQSPSAEVRKWMDEIAAEKP